MVLVGKYSETDNNSMLVICMSVLAVTTALRAAVRAWRCLGPKGVKLLPYRLMVAMMAARASADWLETGAGRAPLGRVGVAGAGATLLSSLGQWSAARERL